MLQTIALQAAFNHLDIFIDPNPDLAASYEERHVCPASFGWGDYNPQLISKGGGILDIEVYQNRPEMKACLALLKMSCHRKVDSLLANSAGGSLWNGGIGTYVK